MSEGIKKYIVISASILLIMLCLGLCWLFSFIWELVMIFAYLLGFANGMLFLGVINYDE